MLLVLRTAAAVAVKPSGSSQPDGLAKARQYLTVISKDWDDKLRRLKHLVERP